MLKLFSTPHVDLSRRLFLSRIPGLAAGAAAVAVPSIPAMAALSISSPLERLETIKAEIRRLVDPHCPPGSRWHFRMGSGDHVIIEQYDPEVRREEGRRGQYFDLPTEKKSYIHWPPMVSL